MIGQKLEGYRFEKAVVAFGGTPTLWWMRFLKKGFYHCMVALKHQDEWVLIDPLIHYTDIICIRKGSAESFLHKHGYKTIEVNIEEPKKQVLRVSPYTCVETAKRFIGIQKRWIFTPYSLFCFLNKKIGKKSLTIFSFCGIVFFSW